MDEMDRYIRAKQELEDVRRGGKDYANCSFMDICNREEKFNIARRCLILALGEKELERLGV